LNLRAWLPLLLGFALLVAGFSACAPAAKTVAGTESVVAGTERVTERVIHGTRQYIKKHGSISDKSQMGPDDPMYWQMYQDSQGGG
jgi:hypothetical protein